MATMHTTTDGRPNESRDIVADLERLYQMHQYIQLADRIRSARRVEVKVSAHLPDAEQVLLIDPTAALAWPELRDPSYPDLMIVCAPSHEDAIQAVVREIRAARRGEGGG